MFLSGDPHADFDAWDREREKMRECCPKCECCEEHIQEDELYNFEGVIVCCQCYLDYVDKTYKKNTDDYMEDQDA